jgi:hypothetical protein
MMALAPKEKLAVSPYRISLLSATGAVTEQRLAHFDNDDRAIDETGKLKHPYRILLHQGERLVGEFPDEPPSRSY